MKKKRIKKSVMFDRRVSAFGSFVLLIFNILLYNETKVYRQNPTSLSIFAGGIFVVTVIVNIVFVFMLLYSNTKRYIKDIYLKPTKNKKSTTSLNNK